MGHDDHLLDDHSGKLDISHVQFDGLQYMVDVSLFLHRTDYYWLIFPS